MNLTPQEAKVRQLLIEPSRKSHVYGLIAALCSIAFFAIGFFSRDRAAFFAGGYVIAIYAFIKYLSAGFRYSSDLRALIEKYEARIRELEEGEEPNQTVEPAPPSRGGSP